MTMRLWHYECDTCTYGGWKRTAGDVPVCSRCQKAMPLIAVEDFRDDWDWYCRAWRSICGNWPTE
jgi:hypothetical protein